jgi:hypothetical protein
MVEGAMTSMPSCITDQVISLPIDTVMTVRLSGELSVNFFSFAASAENEIKRVAMHVANAIIRLMSFYF